MHRQNMCCSFDMCSFELKRVSKTQAAPLLLKYHYLTDQSQSFRVGEYSYGIFDGNRLFGVCIFTGFPVAELFKGIWGFEDFRSMNQDGFYELSRLCISPEYQQQKGMASWIVSKSLRKLKADHAVKKKRAKAVLSYADDNFHSGVVYAASNFKYYGLTAPKYNIWVPCPESEGGKPLPPEKRPGRQETHWKQMTRGWREHLDKGGIKVMRGRKHRFLTVWDKKLPPVLWQEQKWINNKKGLEINTHPETTKHLREASHCESEYSQQSFLLQ